MLVAASLAALMSVHEDEKFFAFGLLPSKLPFAFASFSAGKLRPEFDAPKTGGSRLGDVDTSGGGEVAALSDWAVWAEKNIQKTDFPDTRGHVCPP